MKYEFKSLNLRPEWRWISDRAQCLASEDTKGIVAYKNRDIVAAIALDNWSFNSVTIHVAIDDPYVMRYGFLEECFEYIFSTCDKGVLIGITPADNARALKFNRHLGFEEIYRVQDGYKIGVDYVIQQLRRENCRYLNGQKGNSRAA